MVMPSISLTRQSGTALGLTFVDCGDAILVATVDDDLAREQGARAGDKLLSLEADGMAYEIIGMHARALSAIIGRRQKILLELEDTCQVASLQKAAPQATALAGLGIRGWAEDTPVVTITRLLSHSDIAILHEAARVLRKLQEPHRYDQPHESLFLHAACCTRVKLSLAVFAKEPTASSAAVRLTLRPARSSFIETACPELIRRVLARMRALWPTKLSVRCIEYHSYWPGGCLLDPDHIDAGSTLTLSALLSDPSTLDGGQFLTFSAGAPVAHELECGDAVVFYSERIHNVSAVMSGVRHSLVIELWEGADNIADRHH